MDKSFIELETERREWSQSTFDSSALGSLAKVESEAQEVRENLVKGVDDIEEITDLIMASFDVLMRSGFTLDQFKESYAKKLKINQGRTWEKNEDGSYSHVKITMSKENIIEKIKICETMPELDQCRMLPITYTRETGDTKGFREIQDVFRTKKNQLTRIPLSERNW